MDQQRVQEFKHRYQKLTDREILELQVGADTLVAEASEALNAVVTARKIDLQKLTDEVEQERKLMAEAAEAREKRRARFDSKFTKVFLIFAIPIIIFGLVFRQEKMTETAIKVIVEVLFITLIGYSFIVIKNKLCGRK